MSRTSMSPQFYKETVSCQVLRTIFSKKSCLFLLKSRPKFSVSVPMLTILVRQHQLCFELLISCSYEQCSEYECWGTLIELRESHCTHLINSACVKGGYPLFFMWVLLWIKTSVHARNHRWWPLVVSTLGLLVCSHSTALKQMPRSCSFSSSPYWLSFQTSLALCDRHFFQRDLKLC